MENCLTLRNLLPEVFSHEESAHRGSDIWLVPELNISQGERLLIKAPSGNGKSSLCSFLYGSRSDYSGSLLLDGKSIKELNQKEILYMRRHIIAYLPQDMKLFPDLTALENIELKNRLTAHKSPREILDMMGAAGIKEFANRKAGILSIGQQQRVALVRSLCQPFRFLLLDEPVSHLDNEANDAVSALIDTEVTQNNAAIIVTSVGNDLHLPGLKPFNL